MALLSKTDKVDSLRGWPSFEYVNNSCSLVPAIQGFERINPHLARDHRRGADPHPSFLVVGGGVVYACIVE